MSRSCGAHLISLVLSSLVQFCGTMVQCVLCSTKFPQLHGVDQCTKCTKMKAASPGDQQVIAVRHIYIYDPVSKESLTMGKSVDSCTHNAMDVEFPMSFF